MEWAWLAPALSFAAFGLIVLVGRYLPGKGSWLAILAVAAGFGVFWYVLAAFLDRGAGGGKRVREYAPLTGASWHTIGIPL